MCLVLGALGGVLAATATRPEPVAARFVPPREPAFDFALRDQDGRPTRLADARGKVIAMTFIYTTCRDLCPAEGNDIATAMGEVGGDDVVAYIVSVDPVGDTRPAPSEWLERRGLDGPRPLSGRLTRRTAAGLGHYGIAPMNATREEAPPPPPAPTRSSPPTRRPRQAAVRVPAAAAADRAAARRRRRLPGPRRPGLPRPGPAHRGLGLRALGLRDADRQAGRAAGRHPVRVAGAQRAGARHAASCSPSLELTLRVAPGPSEGILARRR